MKIRGIKKQIKKYIAITCVVSIASAILLSCGYKEPGGYPAFDYNHEYNEMIRCYGEDTYISRQDGIYLLRKDSQTEELIYANPYEVRGGMEIYRNYLYFCGSVDRGGEEAATIYRMNLETYAVEDVLALFSRTFQELHHITIYGNGLYVISGSFLRIGFTMDENGEIAGTLDETADDFLYREYNEYDALVAKVLDEEFDWQEYGDIAERLKEKYRPLSDPAFCKKFLDGKVLVERYKDDFINSIYLEDEDGNYEYLCDSKGFPVLVEGTGFYYTADEDEEILYYDFETKETTVFYVGDRYKDVRMINIDAEYVYLSSFRNVGKTEDGGSVSEAYVLRVPREGGQAEKIYRFAYDQPRLSLYTNCAVDGRYMYFEEYEKISLNPEKNGIQRNNDGAPCEDALAMMDTAERFVSAYLQNDEKTFLSCFIEDYKGKTEMHPYPEQVKQIENTSISTLPEENIPVSTCCEIFYGFRINPETDNIVAYMTIEMVKTEKGFRIRDYKIGF